MSKGKEQAIGASASWTAGSHPAWHTWMHRGVGGRIFDQSLNLPPLTPVTICMPMAHATTAQVAIVGRAQRAVRSLCM